MSDAGSSSAHIVAAAEEAAEAAAAAEAAVAEEEAAAALGASNASSTALDDGGRQRRRAQLAPPVYHDEGFDVRALRPGCEPPADAAGRLTASAAGSSDDGAEGSAPDDAIPWARRSWKGHEPEEQDGLGPDGPLPPDGFRSAFEYEREQYARRKLHARRAMLDAQQGTPIVESPTLVRPRSQPPQSSDEVPGSGSEGAALDEEDSAAAARRELEEAERRREDQEGRLLDDLLCMVKITAA